MDIKAFKMDGLGNDFVIIDRRKNPISINKEKIIELGKRNNIGFDQLIFIDEIDNAVPNYNPITIFNSDGQEVEHVEMVVDVLQKFYVMKKKKKELLL